MTIFKKRCLVCLSVFTLLLTSVGVSFAQIQNDIGQINQEIEQKKQNRDQLGRRINEYEKKIASKQAEQASLSVELDILANRIAKTELEIEETNVEIDIVNAEIHEVQKRIDELEIDIERSRELISAVLQQMQVSDHTIPLEIVFTTDSFSDLLDRMVALETVNEDLASAVEDAKTKREAMEERQSVRVSKRDQLEDLQEDLGKERLVLESSVSAQEILITQTQRSEAQFRVLLRELREEQQYIDREVAVLQSEIEGKLSESDQAGDSTALSWPFNPPKGISASFHDPSYPFRHLFEHSGIDLPAPTGTPVRSAAPGYVAWARTGRMYGNYVMIIHVNGTATLYAHLSRMDVGPDQFVTRGQTIGAVGSTGLSTGPHLHFEVRKNGIPTNPIDYLISR